jgi:hypothetical protein
MGEQGAPSFRMFDFRLDARDDLVCNLVLDIKDFVDVAVEVVSPDFMLSNRIS